MTGNVPKPDETTVAAQFRDDLLAVADALPDLLETVTAAFKLEAAFFQAALAAKSCCFCGPLKRGYIHDDQCAFVDFANVPAVIQLRRDVEADSRSRALSQSERERLEEMRFLVAQGDPARHQSADSRLNLNTVKAWVVGPQRSSAMEAKRDAVLLNDLIQSALKKGASK